MPKSDNSTATIHDPRQLQLPLPGALSYRTASGDLMEIIPRGKHYVEPRGYAAPPGTGPEGETCRSCRHCYRKQMARAYPKCELRSATWTGGRGTDIKVRSPACAKWEAIEP